MANAADLRVISQAVTSISQELAVIMDHVSLYSVQVLAAGRTACVWEVLHVYINHKQVNR